MMTIDLILQDRSGGAWCRAPMHLPAHMLSEIRTRADCTALARDIMYALPVWLLNIVEGVRVQAGDAIGKFSMNERVQAFFGVQCLYKVNLPALRWLLLLLLHVDPLIEKSTATLVV